MPSRAWFCEARVSRKASGEGRAGFDRSAEKAEQTEKTVEPAAREQQPSESQPAADTEVKAQQTADKQAGESASGKPRRRRHRGGRGSNAEPRPRRQRHKTEMRRPRLRWIRSSASRRRRPSPIVRKSARLRPSRNVIPGQIPSVSLMHRLSLPRLIVLPSSPSRPSTARYRRLPLPAFWAGSCSSCPYAYGAL